MELIYQIQQSVRNYFLRKSYYNLYKVIYHNNPLLRKKLYLKINGYKSGNL